MITDKRAVGECAVFMRLHICLFARGAVWEVNELREGGREGGRGREGVGTGEGIEGEREGDIEACYMQTHTRAKYDSHLSS